MRLFSSIQSNVIVCFFLFYFLSKLIFQFFFILYLFLSMIWILVISQYFILYYFYCLISFTFSKLCVLIFYERLYMLGHRRKSQNWISNLFEITQSRCYCDYYHEMAHRCCFKVRDFIIFIFIFNFYFCIYFYVCFLYLFLYLFVSFFSMISWSTLIFFSFFLIISNHCYQFPAVVDLFYFFIFFLLFGEMKVLFVKSKSEYGYQLCILIFFSKFSIY